MALKKRDSSRHGDCSRLRTAGLLAPPTTLVAPSTPLAAVTEQLVAMPRGQVMSSLYSRWHQDSRSWEQASP